MLEIKNIGFEYYFCSESAHHSETWLVKPQLAKFTHNS